MSTFGNTVIGASVTVGGGEIGSKFVAGFTGTITKMFVYVDPGGGTEFIRTAIYDDVSGTPTNKLAESSAEVALTGASPAWFEVPISRAVVNGTTYWLMYRKSAGADAAVAYDTPGDVSDQGAFFNGGSYPTWSDPYGFGGFLDRKVSIYASDASGQTFGLIRR